MKKIATFIQKLNDAGYSKLANQLKVAYYQPMSEAYSMYSELPKSIEEYRKDNTSDKVDFTQSDFQYTRSLPASVVEGLYNQKENYKTTKDFLQKARKVNF